MVNAVFLILRGVLFFFIFISSFLLEGATEKRVHRRSKAFTEADLFNITCSSLLSNKINAEKLLIGFKKEKTLSDEQCSLIGLMTDEHAGEVWKKLYDGEVPGFFKERIGTGIFGLRVVFYLNYFEGGGKEDLNDLREQLENYLTHPEKGLPLMAMKMHIRAIENEGLNSVVEVAAFCVALVVLGVPFIPNFYFEVTQECFIDTIRVAKRL